VAVSLGARLDFAGGGARGYTFGVSGLYVHVPFCERACPYCDFDFQVGRGSRLAAAFENWRGALEREWGEREHEGAELGFDTLYLGGGTPSVLTAGQLRSVFAWLRASVGVEPARLREVTVEFNPEHADEARLDALVELGVGRISLGVQTLAPAGLRELGRVHEREGALAAIERCVARGLRTSADLILGWRGQGAAALIRDIDELVAAGVEHLSIYALTIEPETPWPKLVRRGLRILPDDDLQGELLLLAERELVARGFAHYEVASYARPGAEALHNVKYWTWADVLGLGPSAASVRIRSAAGQAVVERRNNPRGLQAWAGSAQPNLETLRGAEAAAEGLWLGLRYLRGVDVKTFQVRFGVDRAWLEARVARQVGLGNLEWSADQAVIRVAPDRWLWHDDIAVDIL
jgi:oxygen-independent coproporphyrinogen III oxidase